MAGTIPTSVFIRVDLPDPLGPMMVTISPAIDRQIGAVHDFGVAVAGAQIRSTSSRAIDLAAQVGVDHALIALHLIPADPGSGPSPGP